MTVEVSHGRGGAGNIKEDETSYVDGEVVRAGIEGSHGDGAYSAGRGGKFKYLALDMIHPISPLADPDCVTFCATCASRPPTGRLLRRVFAIRSLSRALMNLPHLCLVFPMKLTCRLFDEFRCW